MNLFDETPPHAPGPESMADPNPAAPNPAAPNPAAHRAEGSPTIEGEQASLSGDPITYVAAARAGAYGQNLAIPEDLRISWGWPHLLLFLFFASVSFVVVQTALFFYYGPRQPLPKDELERYLLNKPQFIFGTNLLWYAAVFFFLSVTFSVLRGAPFWSTLGWTKIKSTLTGNWGGGWAYFFGGCALAIFVGLASSRVHIKENMPIQELFKNRENAILLMCMAVLIAPLVEETVFRGYFYPLFTRIIYAVGSRAGVGATEAVRVGTRSSILLTGVLFGLMHGAQLGWSWGVVGLLIFVGIVFTLVRARTGTVMASFLLHVGYNSMIAVTTIIGTHGFTRIPTSP
jgi:membrane protease YdiL (CAAX protease family)